MESAVAGESDVAAEGSAVITPAKTGPKFDIIGSLPFTLVHFSALAAIWTGITWQAVVVGIALYWMRMFGVSGGYHRYFAHRTFKTSRAGQFILAFWAQTSAQRGVLWWALHHRTHHKYSDLPGDVHSPKQKGFFYSHVGWIFRYVSDTDFKKVRDLAKYPELRFLDKFHWLPPLMLALAVYAWLGPAGIIVGFGWSTVVLWHGTFTINSLAHVWGKRRYATTDTSRNNPFLAFITMGEGWHNNHHYFMNSTRQGFYWWEFDFSYYVLKVMSWMHLVWDLKPPPTHAFKTA